VSSALIQIAVGVLLVVILVRIAGRPGMRLLAPVAVISLWLAAYALWAFVGGLAHQHNLIHTYHPRLFWVLALIGGVLHYRAWVGGKRLQARLVFVAGQVVWVAILIAQHNTMAPSGGAASPLILSGFGDWLGAEGFPRVEGRFPHSGVDVAGSLGSPVLAAADGLVTVAQEGRDTCGAIVVIDHLTFGYSTIYCHLSQVSVSPGEEVKRGQRIGAIGTTGLSAWPGYEHVHWELQPRGRFWDREDPLSRTVGCFDETLVYPTNRFVLTYPVSCGKAHR